jgi:hypothetical protein
MRTTLFTLSLVFIGSSVAFPTTPNDSRTGAAGCPFAAAQAKRQLGKSFDPVKQKIDVSGEHAFRPPGPGDQRVTRFMSLLVLL